jgi:hypothetical protein
MLDEQLPTLMLEKALPINVLAQMSLVQPFQVIEILSLLNESELPLDKMSQILI